MKKFALLLVDFLEAMELKKARVDDGLSPEDKTSERAIRALNPGPASVPKNFIASNWPKKFIKDVLKHKLSREKDIMPNLSKSDSMAGIPIPEELLQHDGPVPRNHPNRDLAVKFVTDVHRRNKYEGLRASIKFLGIGEGGQTVDPSINEKYGEIEDTEKAQKIIPAQISPPMIQDDTVITSSVGVISGPTVLNNVGNANMKKAYDYKKEKLKDIVKHLKNMQKPPLNLPPPNPKDPVLNYDKQGPKPPKR